MTYNELEPVVPAKTQVPVTRSVENVRPAHDFDLLTVGDTSVSG